MKRNIYSFKRVLRPLILLFFLAFSIPGTTQTFSYFDRSTQPAGGAGFTQSQNDGGGGIVNGIKFRVTQGGTISSVWFYRGDANDNQTYTGLIWDIATSTSTPAGAGTLTVSGSPAVGWQEIVLGTPLHITTGRTYVASVFSPNGNYTFSDLNSTETFDDDDINNPPFIIIGDVNSIVDPGNVGNGVFAYTNSNGSYPAQNANGISNYWIDVEFTTDAPLPVSLVDLKATALSKDITVSWKTASESNNKGFQIERSNDGAEWYPLGFVAGAGESNSLRSYNYIDRNLAPGLYYYRVRQTDLDGKSTLSSIVTASIGGKGKALLFQNYPNPFRGHSSIRFDIPTMQNVRLSILDITGREVKLLANKRAEPGTHQVSISSDGLQPALYIIRLQTESGTLTRNMLVQ